ncbi:energy transducer TonB [Bacteroides finegoldii]|jgi:putative outer membrane protein|uniref:energy transducer TonB n=1 Tax=Bacteroides finegoldii TaxID=338188 RepID=UPI0003407BB2|nr:carboxypeptidase-like regulatory domain-containing protein [Bacteroides finegoldii]MDC7141578.1 carboxypeptidase-like regulatory domain-containing protein [Bacteroides finegoldii]CDC53276.1 putative outer membrane protein [Bacteroides finegoldii CAG:203]
MRLSDYIQGLRKGKEAHRLEKESMKDPFLADAIDGYNQVEGNHEQRIEQLRIQISARSTKKRNTYAIIWSVAACLVIGFGISSYFLFLKETPEPVIPIIPQKEIALVPTKTKTDSTPISPVSMKQADKKDIIAKSRTTISKPPSAPITTMPMEEETSDQMVAATDEEVIMTTGASDPESVKKMRIAKMAVIPTNDIIKGKVTDQKGEPLIGASVMYKGTNIGTVTDVNGEFSLLKKAENKQLTAQYIGYDPVEVPVDTSRTMLIAMNEDQKGLSEVVVVGHGVNKKANKDNTPQPVDGKRKYLKYLKKNLVRPTDETCAQVKGKVVLTFLVNRDGRPFHIKVKKSLCESSDKEAIRLVQEGPDWTYGNKQAEVTVKFD